MRSHLKDLAELNLYQAKKYGLKNVDINKDAFKNLTKLLSLDLSNNRLTYIPGNLPPSLTTIRLNNNSILVLNQNSFSGIRNVKNLFLQRNCYLGNNCSKQLNISDNTFAVLTKLEFLAISFNNLRHVPKGLPKTLIILSLSDNQIYYISEEDFKELHYLNVLSIHGNGQRCENAAYPFVPCPNISLGIHTKALTNLNQLKTLHLASNSL